MKISQIPARRLNLAVFLLLLSFVPASAQTPNTLGGHIGLAFPLVTTNEGTTTTIGQNFTIVVPVGISVKGPGSLMFDLEFEPAIQDSPVMGSWTRLLGGRPAVLCREFPDFRTYGRGDQKLAD